MQEFLKVDKNFQIEGDNLINKNSDCLKNYRTLEIWKKESLDNNHKAMFWSYGICLVAKTIETMNKEKEMVYVSLAEENEYMNCKLKEVSGLPSNHLTSSNINILAIHSNTRDNDF